MPNRALANQLIYHLAEKIPISVGFKTGTYAYPGESLLRADLALLMDRLLDLSGSRGRIDKRKQNIELYSGLRRFRIVVNKMYSRF